MSVFFNDLKRGGSHLACIFLNNIELLILVGYSCYLVPIKFEEENATFNDKNIGDGLCKIVVEDFKKTMSFEYSFCSTSFNCKYTYIKSRFIVAHRHLTVQENEM